MARFIATRTLPPLSPEQLDAVGKSVVTACRQIDGMTWIHSHITADGKHSFCEFEAPDAEAVRRHAQIAGLPLDEVVPLGIEIGPALYS
jgi:hypothetical protein